MKKNIVLVLLAAGAFLSVSVTPRAVSKTRPAATCIGDSPCKACKNCRYCKRCAKEGKFCGVCKK